MLSLRSRGLSGAAGLKLRSWCRLRCGLIVLRHLGRRESRARYQDCIWCNCSIRNATVHCLSVCCRWQQIRAQLANAMGVHPQDNHQAFALRALGANLSATALEIVASWAADLDRESYDFWLER